MAFSDNFGNPKGLLGRMMLVFMDKEHKPMATWALEKIEMPKEGFVLDIGCGGGYNIKRMLKLSENAMFKGIDISKESVRKAKKVNKKNSRVEIIEGTVESLPFSDDSFDLITAFETVFFWPNVKENIKEVYRTVKKGGRFIVINNYGDPNVDWEKKVPCMKRYTKEQIKDLMENANFVNIELESKDNLFLVSGYKL